MVRSLYMRKGVPPRPARRARYSTGPGLDRRMPSAAAASSGAAASKPTAARVTSTRRLTTAHRPADGHEDLGRVHAVLVAPRLRPVAQPVQRPRVRVRPDLALVARHRDDLRIERR